MTAKQSQEIEDFIIQVQDKSMDSLDFAQLMFTIEDIITVDNYKSFYDENLDKLVKLLAENYTEELTQWFTELDVPARAWVLSYSGALDGVS